jgi:hypothetical protein
MKKSRRLRHGTPTDIKMPTDLMLTDLNIMGTGVVTSISLTLRRLHRNIRISLKAAAA